MYGDLTTKKERISKSKGVTSNPVLRAHKGEKFIEAKKKAMNKVLAKAKK